MDNNNNNSEFIPYGEGDDDIDPFDSPFLQNLIDNFDPTLIFLSNDEDNALPQQQSDPYKGLQQGNVPFQNPMIHDQSTQGNNYINIPNGGGVEAGSSTRKGKEPMIEDQSMHENNNFFNGGGYKNMAPQEEDNVEVISLLSWPPKPSPFSCSCCQVLRQIIHTNGSKFEKLEIHGAIGVITHAIIENQEMTASGPSIHSHQMIDFNNRNAEQIKSFLVKYCADQANLGYIIVKDPLSGYYEAICSGLDWAEDFSSDEDDDLISPNDMETESVGTSTCRPNMGPQRERVARMTLSDLSDVFHIPIKAAAEQLGVCTTVVKKICRRANLKRWPQRKVTSLWKQVTVLRRALDSPDPRTREKTRVEIRRLQQRMIENCGGITPTGIQMLQV